MPRPLSANQDFERIAGRVYPRTSPRWRTRAATVQLDNVTLTIPHPLDILIGKLSRLEAKDVKAFERVIQLSGHPTADELRSELQDRRAQICFDNGIR